jgi:hypothetical protein
MAKLGHTYSVYVDDNFHYQDEGARYKLADFSTLAGAVAACQQVVDQYLKDEVPLDLSPADRYRLYTGFGPDPFIMTDDPSAGHPPFSAWTYAQAQCHAQSHED